MLIWGITPYGGYLSDFNLDILRNSLTMGTGRWIEDSTNNNKTGIGIGDDDGCFVFGLLMRDNQVPYNQTIFPTNGVNGIAENMIEQNDANVIGMQNMPGYILQDNSPPGKF